MSKCAEAHRIQKTVSASNDSFSSGRSFLLFGLSAAFYIATLVAPTNTASAESCQVKDGDGSIQVGGVGSYGDLKIRHTNDFHVGENPYTAKYYAVADLKAPGFLVTAVQFEHAKPLRFSICGQDVTITYTYAGNGALFLVSVF